jgi:pyruvate dehydrogenase E1 component alpha subunit
MSLVATTEAAPPITAKPYQILTPEGKVVGRVPDLPADRLLRFYRWMVFGRVVSDRMVALQRQGRMGTFSPLNGQEATLIGMAAPLQAHDWLLGSYREFLAYHVKGVPLLSQYKQWVGNIADDFPYEVGCVPFQIVLATQVLHTVGIAMAMKYKNEPYVALAGCGDGATSEGDFNEALNFAGVFKAPVVFVIQNNGWAISTPRSKQSAAKHLADRGPGFGVPSYVVDGNDVLAVYQVVSDCVAQARAGEGPSLIEAITYRIGAHTTADDPTRYRPETELQEWARRDPITRFRKFLLERNVLTEIEEKRIYDEVNVEFEAAVTAYTALPPQSPHRQFELVFAAPTPQLKQQQAQFLRELGLE